MLPQLAVSKSKLNIIALKLIYQQLINIIYQ